MLFDVSVKNLDKFSTFLDMFWLEIEDMALKMAENLTERQDEWGGEPVKL